MFSRERTPFTGNEIASTCFLPAGYHHLIPFVEKSFVWTLF
jgi:hypothetical protein